MTRTNRLKELVLQALEHERCGLQVYETAVNCAQNPDLREEWQKYMSETQNHADVLERLCAQLGFDAEEETPGRQVVRHLGDALLGAMELAKAAGDPVAAELVACECVVLAETKDHLNWTLLGTCAVGAEGLNRSALQRLVPRALDQEPGPQRRDTAPGRAPKSEYGDGRGQGRGLCQKLASSHEPRTAMKVWPAAPESSFKNTLV